MNQSHSASASHVADLLSTLLASTDANGRSSYSASEVDACVLLIALSELDAGAERRELGTAMRYVERVFRRAGVVPGDSPEEAACKVDAYFVRAPIDPVLLGRLERALASSPAPTLRDVSLGKRLCSDWTKAARHIDEQHNRGTLLAFLIRERS